MALALFKQTSFDRKASMSPTVTPKVTYGAFFPIMAAEAMRGHNCLAICSFQKKRIQIHKISLCPTFSTFCPFFSFSVQKFGRAQKWTPPQKRRRSGVVGTWHGVHSSSDDRWLAGHASVCLGRWMGELGTTWSTWRWGSRVLFGSFWYTYTLSLSYNYVCFTHIYTVTDIHMIYAYVYIYNIYIYIQV